MFKVRRSAPRSGGGILNAYSDHQSACGRLALRSFRFPGCVTALQVSNQEIKHAKLPTLVLKKVPLRFEFLRGLGKHPKKLPLQIITVSSVGSRATMHDADDRTGSLLWWRLAKADARLDNCNLKALTPAIVEDRNAIASANAHSEVFQFDWPRNKAQRIRVRVKCRARWKRRKTQSQKRSVHRVRAESPNILLSRFIPASSGAGVFVARDKAAGGGGLCFGDSARSTRPNATSTDPNATSTALSAASEPAAAADGARVAGR